MRLRTVVRRVAEEYRAHWKTLLVAGIVVFVPLGLLEVVADELQHPLLENDAESLDTGTVATIAAAIVGVAAGTLIGEVVYTGIVSSIVVTRRRGGDVGERGLREFLRHLPIGRLIAIDVLWVLVVMLGFVAFIVPGFVFLAWFALVAPACEIEDLGVRDSFRRSRELVRGHFWRVLVLIAGLLAAEELLTSAAGSISIWGLGENVGGDWLASVLTGLLVSPLWALAAVVMFLELRDRAAPGA
jgi:hypothetical protein